jgi:hypothetical protein
MGERDTTPTIVHVDEPFKRFIIRGYGARTRALDQLGPE